MTHGHGETGRSAEPAASQGAGTWTLPWWGSDRGGECAPGSENSGALGYQARHTFLHRVQRGANLLS